MSQHHVFWFILFSTYISHKIDQKFFKTVFQMLDKNDIKGKSYVYLQVQVYIAKIVYLQVYHFGYVYL